MTDRETINPFRSLLEAWCLQEMIWHYDEAGMILRHNMGIHSFQDMSNVWVYRAFAASKGNFRHFIAILMNDMPDRLRKIFWARLAVIKKTPKTDTVWRNDGTQELDVDEVLAVLDRDDDLELIDFCIERELTDVGLKRGEWRDGHSESLRGVRP